MVFLRKVSIHEQDYFYLLGYTANPFKKYKKYIGKKEPTKKEIKKLQQEFMQEIRTNPDTQEMHEKNLIQLLQEIQEKQGYVSEEAIIKLSKEMGIPTINLYGVLTFYSQFKLKQPGKHHVCVCRGTACHVKKSDEILKALEEQLKIKHGETTKDKEFSLEAVNCIGACARAPAIMINKKVYGELDKDKSRKLIQKIRSEKKE